MLDGCVQPFRLDGIDRTRPYGSPLVRLGTPCQKRGKRRRPCAGKEASSVHGLQDDLPMTSATTDGNDLGGGANTAPSSDQLAKPRPRQQERFPILA